MIFLIEYDRPSGKIVEMRKFADSERMTAQDARLELELKLHRQGIRREVVILEASSEAALRHTHSRYFDDIREIVREKLSA